jgi:hypothetical protein
MAGACPSCARDLETNLNEGDIISFIMNHSWDYDTIIQLNIGEPSEVLFLLHHLPVLAKTSELFLVGASYQEIAKPADAFATPTLVAIAACADERRLLRARSTVCSYSP